MPRHREAYLPKGKNRLKPGRLRRVHLAEGIPATKTPPAKRFAGGVFFTGSAMQNELAPTG
jgi:hypothetical protein